jgi:hypothetical protein
LGNARSKWEGPGPHFWFKAGNGSQYYELNIGKTTIAKCSRVHNVLVCALKHNPDSFCSSRMVPQLSVFTHLNSNISGFKIPNSRHFT